MTTSDAGGDSTKDIAVPEVIRLVDMQTGELRDGDVGSILDELFGAGAARQRTDEPFSEADGTQAASRAPGLYGEPYLAKSEKKVHVSVFADIVEAHTSGKRRCEDDCDEAEFSQIGQGHRKDPRTSVRGVIVGFQRRPRSRMIRTLAKIRNVNGGHFFTLTFPDAVWTRFDAGDQSGMARFAKRKLAAFQKALVRFEESAGGIWRLEFKSRKSGQLIGVCVPHFHLLVFGIENASLGLLRFWLSDAWYSIVGSEDAHHLQAGTNCRELTSRRHAAAYVSKYVGKEENDDFAAGRRWGVFGALDQSASAEFDLDGDQWVQFKRLVRGWLKSRRSRFAVVLARMPAQVGASVLGLGDESSRGSPLDPVVMRMLLAVGVDACAAAARARGTM